MSRLEVTPVRSSREQRWFLSLPWQIYRDDPYWVPPLRQHQKEMVGFARHPFYNDASGEAFLAFRDGRPCGRVLAIVNHAHNRRYHERRGFFGFFECADDGDVAAGLFRAVREWFAGQGVDEIRGPCNPSLNYECGLLVDGFDSPPTFMMTYNRPYYGALLEACGFQKVQDLYAFWGHVEMLAALDQKLAFVVEEASRRFQVQVRRLDRKRFDQEVRMFLDIYNQSLVGTWGYVPLSEAEVDHLGAALKHLIVPEMTTVAEVEGRPVGAVFGLLDYNPRIKQIDGRLYPFGFIRLLSHRRRIKRVRLISTNVLPEYQRWGLGLVLVARLVPEALAWGIEEAEFSWVLESNHLSRATLQRGGAKLAKTYRIYDFPAVEAAAAPAAAGASSP
jgi:GNAT superfamily N-acetyltransferase